MGQKKFTISHLRKDCIGCGVCSAIAPHTWEMDQNDGLMNLKNAVEKKGIFVAEVDEDLYEDNKIAADSCPVKIIRIQE